MKRRAVRLPFLFAALSALVLAASGCRGTGATVAGGSNGAAGGRGAPVRFVDVAETLGVRFQHTNGASGRLYLAETMGSGCAFLDYDGDGRLDLCFANSSPLPGFRRKGPFHPGLFHQLAGGRFEDVTARAGLAVEGYGMGCAVGDYDNDGDPDLYLTYLGPNRLFRNEGNGTFEDVTARSGTGDARWGSSAAWFDYDRDGDLDLFVCNYCHWAPALNHSCSDSSGSYICGPKFYRGSASILYRNNGDGTFTDVSRRAGVHHEAGKALGIVVWDVDRDGWLDFAVANDTVPNWLFRNNRNGTFTEMSVEAGVAYASTGLARAGMGIDTVDYENRGREALLVGNNTSEGFALFRLESEASELGGVHFADAAQETGIFEASMPFSTFGAAALDVDLDGYWDLATANGHVNEYVARLGGSVEFAQRMQIFHNEPGGQTGSRRFRDVAAEAGSGLTTRRVGRGLAVGDVDGDGDPDLLVSANNGPAAILRNETIPTTDDRRPATADAPSFNQQSAISNQQSRHWLAIHPRGTRNNRDGIGTRVVLRAGGRSQMSWVRSGSSYCSDSEHVARFGLGAATQADRVELYWPSGAVQTLRDVRADQVLPVTEPAR